MAIQKNIIDRYQAITNGDMSQATVTSTYADIRYLDNVGIQVKWTSASAVGVITVECSDNYNPDKNITGSWVALTFSPALTQPASNNGEYLININQCPHAWIRVVYTKTSGTGTLNVWVNAKEI